MQVKIDGETDLLDMVIKGWTASVMKARENARILVTPDGNIDPTMEMEMEDLKVPVEDAGFIINCLCELREYRKKGEKERNGNMEITYGDMEKIVADLKALAERKNLNKQLKESAAKAAVMVKEVAEMMAKPEKSTPEQREQIVKEAVGKDSDANSIKPDEWPEPDVIPVEVFIPGAPAQKLWMGRYDAENMAAGFRQHNKPTFACNLPNMRLQYGGLWEVDLRQVACITSKGLKLAEEDRQKEQEEPEEDYRSVPSYKNRSRSQGWRRGNVTCHNCGADYETDINEKWAFVRCKYCNETDTTVTFDD